MSTTEENKERVRHYINQAVAILRAEGPEFERVSWILEDTLTLLDDVNSDSESEETLENEVMAIRKLLASG